LRRGIKWFLSDVTPNYAKGDRLFFRPTIRQDGVYPTGDPGHVTGHPGQELESVKHVAVFHCGPPRFPTSSIIQLAGTPDTHPIILHDALRMDRTLTCHLLRFNQTGTG